MGKTDGLLITSHAQLMINYFYVINKPSLDWDEPNMTSLKQRIRERFDEELVDFGNEVISENGSHDVVQTKIIASRDPNDFYRLLDSIVDETLDAAIGAVVEKFKMEHINMTEVSYGTGYDAAREQTLLALEKLKQ